LGFFSSANVDDQDETDEGSTLNRQGVEDEDTMQIDTDLPVSDSRINQAIEEYVGMSTGEGQDYYSNSTDLEEDEITLYAIKHWKSSLSSSSPSDKDTATESESTTISSRTKGKGKSKTSTKPTPKAKGSAVTTEGTITEDGKGDEDIVGFIWKSHLVESDFTLNSAGIQ
jgi:hypothetical protein